MKVALQLFSVRDIRNDHGLAAALDKAKELGYEGVEFAGWGDLTPEQAKTEMEKRGLICSGFHIGYKVILEDVQKQIAMAKDFGAYSLCVPVPPTSELETAEDWIAFAKSLNDIGKEFRQSGIRFGYHNHLVEFSPLENGALPIDLILENCDKENVFLEFDPRHTLLAGAAPLDFIRGYADRVTVLHARDTDGENDTAVGQGMIDFPTLMDIIGTPAWAVVENGNHGENQQQLIDSLKYLKENF